MLHQQQQKQNSNHSNQLHKESALSPSKISFSISSSKPLHKLFIQHLTKLHAFKSARNMHFQPTNNSHFSTKFHKTPGRSPISHNQFTPYDNKTSIFQINAQEIYILIEQKHCHFRSIPPQSLQTTTTTTTTTTESANQRNLHLKTGRRRP